MVNVVFVNHYQESYIAIRIAYCNEVLMKSDSMESGHRITEYLQVSRLAHEFRIFSNSESHDLKKKAINSAIKALAIMERCGALHPDHKSMVKFAGEENSLYDNNWCDRVANTSDETVTVNSTSLYEALHSRHADRADRATLFSTVRTLFALHMIQEDYSSVQKILGMTSSLQFQSHPATAAELQENKFIEFNFYHYAFNLYNLVLFPSSSEMNEEPTSTNSNSHRVLANIVKKVATYYERNSILFNNNTESTEYRYYIAIRWLEFLALFKKGMFSDFINSFFSFMINNTETEDSNVLMDNAIDLKSEVLVMLKITILITKPFKNQSFLNFQPSKDNIDNELFFELYDNQDSLEGITHQIFMKLSTCDFESFRSLFSSNQYATELVGKIGYVFPGEGNVFLDYLRNLIDFKMFILIMSMTKKISKNELLSLMGCDNVNITDKLLIFIASLKLGDYGIGYNMQDEMFFNNGRQPYDIDADLERLSNSIAGESIANLTKGSLLGLVLDS
ncbi:Piso0_000695 [Millerozyma farinosa CBS 7064]|uniref:Piso0_000695 protein n=1 Tax=Pichia sorbitophila (strain ATCC MYA-4447 / BCRC 22081 / CBS 7064 / NBRC 10061 / NRRL Y-12695) TaxID=559304 RepID=G8YR95_PICSO|nr:Piso0_000695 [Millerozyma farinosa CBS 7064]